MRTALRLAAGAALAAAAVLVSGAAPARLAAQAGPLLQARIKIDTDRVVGDVDPLLFGSFAEHLGRMIYGGIYDEGSPLADADGYRTDVMRAAKDLGVTVLRWPGGNFVSGYHWKDGIGPKDLRPVRLDLAWNAVESNRFGPSYSRDAMSFARRMPLSLASGTIRRSSSTATSPFLNTSVEAIGPSHASSPMSGSASNPPMSELAMRVAARVVSASLKYTLTTS